MRRPISRYPRCSAHGSASSSLALTPPYSFGAPSRRASSSTTGSSALPRPWPRRARATSRLPRALPSGAVSGSRSCSRNSRARYPRGNTPATASTAGATTAMDRQAYRPILGPVRDEVYMRRALALARRGLGRTSPNPVVGSVVLRGDEVVGEGWHQRAGEPHAEVIALERAGPAARGATLYATLEPCAHVGRTPPCVDAVLAAGVSRAVIATRDPDPRVDGRGVARLREAGIAVTEGVLAPDAEALNRPFFKHIRMRLPWVMLKLALSLDGRVTAPGRRYLTGAEARRHVHRLRDEHDAVLVGIGTVLAADPQLTVRDVRGRDPLRVVLDAHARTPPNARVVGNDGRAVVFVREGADAARVDALREAGARIAAIPGAEDGLDVRAALAWLDRHDVLSVLLEAGPTLASAMLRAGLVDEALFIYAPIVVGDAGLPALGAKLEPLALRDTRVFRLGADVALHGLVPPD